MRERLCRMLVWDITSVDKLLGCTLLCVVLFCACTSEATGSKCGVKPSSASAGAATPQIATQGTLATDRLVVVRVWSDCFQPDKVTVRSGELIQWQAAEDGIAPEIVLEDGSPLGQVRHMLEFRFATPGTYRYHVQLQPSVVGTVVVVP